MIKLIIYAIIAIVLIGLVILGVGGYFLFDFFGQAGNEVAGNSGDSDLISNIIRLIQLFSQ